MSGKPKIFAVVNQKGGVGKTTTSINLADGLARKCRKENTGHVLLIDFDAQGNCATSLGIDMSGRPSLSDVLQGQATLKECLVLADRRDQSLPRPNLWVLPSDQRLAETKTELIMQEALTNAMSIMRPTQAQRIPLLKLLEVKVKPLADRFAFTIIDCPPAHDALSNAVYQMADAAIVPVKLDFLSAIGAGQHIENVRQAQLQGIEIAIHTVVPTFYIERQVQDNQVLDSLRRTYGLKTVSEPIPKNQVVPESMASGGGMTLFEYAPASAAARAYGKLVERVYNG